MNSKLKWLVALIALQAMWVLGMVVTHEWRLRSGARVILETALVDPRDWLRGDYLILNYKISTVPMNLISGLTTNSPAPGTPIYVQLSRQGSFHQIDLADMRPIAAKPGTILIVGQVSVRSDWPMASQPGSDRGLLVDYGLERYFVSEGKGSPRGTLTVEASVSTSGNALIRQVFVEGKPYREAMRSQRQ